MSNDNEKYRYCPGCGDAHEGDGWRCVRDKVEVLCETCEAWKRADEHYEKELDTLRAALAKVERERDEYAKHLDRPLHSDWEKASREKLLEGLRYQGSITQALLSQQERTVDDLAAMTERANYYREHLQFVSWQCCERTDDGDVRVCPESGDCVTEYCLPCYARAALKEE